GRPAAVEGRAGMGSSHEKTARSRIRLAISGISHATSRGPKLQACSKALESTSTESDGCRLRDAPVAAITSLPKAIQTLCSVCRRRARLHDLLGWVPWRGMRCRLVPDLGGAQKIGMEAALSSAARATRIKASAPGPYLEK